MKIMKPKGPRTEHFGIPDRKDRTFNKYYEQYTHREGVWTARPKWQLSPEKRYVN